MKAKQFVIGLSKDNRPTIQIYSQYDLTYHQFIKLSKLSACRYSSHTFSKPRNETGMVFEFSIVDNVEKAKEILFDANYSEKL